MRLNMRIKTFYTISILLLFIMSIKANAQITYLQVSNQTSSSATVSWNSSDSVDACVYYGLTTALGDSANDVMIDDVHFVQISGLLLDTTYYYEIRSGDEYDNNYGSYYTFRTMKVGTGVPYLIYGTVYSTDSITPAERILSSIVVKGSGNTLTYPLGDLTDSDGIWYLNLGNLKDTSTNDVFSYSIGDTIILKLYGGNDGMASSMIIIDGSEPQDCGTLTLDTSTTPHVMFPTVPTQNQSNVSSDANMAAYFDVELDEVSLNDSTILVYGNYSGYKEGIISYNPIGNEVTYDPLSGYFPGEIVTVILTTGIKSITGATLENPVIWTFTVEATDGKGIFQEAEFVDVGVSAFRIRAADIDNNGAIDLVSACHSTECSKLSVTLNSGLGQFGTPIILPTTRPFGVVASDLNGDGLIDLAAANENEFTATIFENIGDSTFTNAGTYTVDNNPRYIEAADFNGDGKIDLVTGNNLGNSVSVLINTGNGNFSSHVDYEAQSIDCRPDAIFTGDYDNDYDIDIATICRAASAIAVFLNDGNGGFDSCSITYGFGYQPRSLYATNFNSDNVLDIVVANSGGLTSYRDSSVTIVSGNGDGTFSAHNEILVGWGPMFVCAADIDNDDDQDIAVNINYADTGDTYVSVLNNDGGWNLSHGDTVFFSGGMGLVTADFNNDGAIDLAGSSTGVGILWNINSEFILGDANNDSTINIFDITHLISYLYLNGDIPEPLEIASGDVNCDCVINIFDITCLITNLYIGGCEPCSIDDWMDACGTP